MAIQCRRGQYKDFDKSKMLPGEWAVVLSGDPLGQDGRSVYMCFAPNVVKRMATYEDMSEIIASETDSIVEDITAGVPSALDEKFEAWKAEVGGSIGGGTQIEYVSDTVAVAGVEALF